jgi:hypothetical protein
MFGAKLCFIPTRRVKTKAHSMFTISGELQLFAVQQARSLFLCFGRFSREQLP